MHPNPFSAGAFPGPRWGAYDAPPDPLVGWGGGYPLPIPLPARRLRRHELGAASVLRSPSAQNHGYASAKMTNSHYEVHSSVRGAAMSNDDGNDC